MKRRPKGAGGAGRERRRSLAGATMVLGAFALTALLSGWIAQDAAAKQPVKVKLQVKSTAQADVLSSGRLAVKVRASGPAKVKVSARHGDRSIAETTRAKLNRKGSKRVRLALSRRGRELLGTCGAHTVRVHGSYRSSATKRKRKAKARRALAADQSLCPPGGEGPLHVETEAGCDPIDPRHCMLPYPNDFLTVPDPSSETGRRLDLRPESMPKSLAGTSIFSPDYNRNDGFSPNNTILTRVPGLDTQAAFAANGLVSQTDIGAYDDPDQRLVLIDAQTGERHPVWAELDKIPAGDDQRLLIAHPAEALEYGRRYIVALRDLRGAGGQLLEPNPVFKAYRDDRPTDNADVEARRPQMEEIFARLGQAGIARDDLYLAWDFTVASQENLTERLLAMRDDAFAQLGDTQLADGEVQGDAPEINDVDDYEYALCDSDTTPECEQEGVSYPDYEGTGPTNGDVYTGTSQSDYAFKRVTGTVTVPCYMEAPGEASNQVDPEVPCAAGSRLHYEGDSDVPSQDGDTIWEAPFTCVVPRTGDGETDMATGMPGVYFGHGLLQNHRVLEQLGLFPASMDGVSCGTDWIGLSAIDPVTGAVLDHGDLNFLVNLLPDLSKFPALPDRTQQGYVNAMYVARAMVHPQGIADLPELDEGDGAALDPSEELGYLGVSLGGINGGATTAVAPDWQRAVLSVPGMGFTTLLTRSTQFNQFLPLVYSQYPDPLERQLGISILQLAWDRGEPSAYVHGMLDGRFGTPEHEVMIHEAFGDHQVANVQTETLARSLGAVVKTPALAPGRSPDSEPFWGLDQAPSTAFNVPGGYGGPHAASLFVFDTGPIRTENGIFVGTNPNPVSNVAPVDATASEPKDGRDPHEPAATSPAAQALIIPFLLGQGTFDSCVTPAPAHPFSPPYSGAPSPCTAPPVHSVGEGL